MNILLPVIIVAVLGLIAAVGLVLAAKFMAVPVDEKQEKIKEVLPGANCGACGFSGCDGYAAAIAEGKASPDKCSAGGDSVAKALAEVLGVEVKSEQNIAFIACGCNKDLTKQKYEYEGKKSCLAASLLHNGPLECGFGCIGFGDCAAVCPFNAIVMVDNKPCVSEELCVGCGKCVNTCPKSVISLIPKGAKIKIVCSNKQKGPQVVKNCGASCIACGLCVKQCEKQAIKLVDNLPVVDYSLCDACGKCANACKRGVIK